MQLIIEYWFEILLLLFLLAWVILRRSGWWKRTITSHYKANRQIQASFDETWQAVEQAIQESGFTLHDKKYRDGTFYAETNWSMKSIGEHIQVTLTKEKNGINVYFLSTCKLETQFIDWGKNRQNANRFFYSLFNER